MKAGLRLDVSAGWALSYVKRGRALRLLVIGIGLPLSLVFADIPQDYLKDELFLGSLVIFLVATGLT